MKKLLSYIILTLFFHANIVFAIPVDQTVGTAGKDTNGVWQFLKVDASGNLLVSAATSSIPTSTVAALPATCTDGEDQYILTDGDAKGALVICEGNKFYCAYELATGTIPIICPPYNATADSTNNATAYSAMFARGIEWATTTTKPARMLLPEAYITTSALTFTGPASGTTLAFHMVGGSSVAGIICNMVGGICLTVDMPSAGVGNKFILEDLRIRGQGTNLPQDLLYANNLSQLELKNPSFSNFSRYALRLNGPQHVSARGGVWTENQAASAGGCWISADNNNAEIVIANGTIEGVSGSVLTFFCTGNNDNRDIAISNMKSTVNGMLNFFKSNGSGAISRLTITNNSIKNISGQALALTGNVGAGTEALVKELKVSGNFFQSTGATAFAAELTGLSKADIVDNTFDGFAGIRTVGTNTNLSITRNRIINTQTGFRCFQINGTWSGLTILDNIVNDCKNDILNISGTNNGNNIMGRFRIEDTTTRDDSTKWVYSSASPITAPDSFPLLDLIHPIACTGTTLTINQPAYSNVVITDASNAGGCDITMGTGLPGQIVNVTLAANTGGGTVQIRQDTSTAYVGLTVYTTTKVVRQFQYGPTNGSGWFNTF